MKLYLVGGSYEPFRNFSMPAEKIGARKKSLVCQFPYSTLTNAKPPRRNKIVKWLAQEVREKLRN